MALYTVIWRDNGDDFMITTVELGDVIDARQMDTNEWADLAYETECKANGWTDEDMEGYLPSNDGYDLITVIAGVPEYIY